MDATPASGVAPVTATRDDMVVHARCRKSGPDDEDEDEDSLIVSVWLLPVASMYLNDTSRFGVFMSLC